jgi:phosphohistidine phosphatase SixA
VDLRLGDGYDLVALGAIATGTGVAAPMLVGHDPDLSFALAALCRGDGLTMRKGALATIDVRLPFVPGAGTLRWLIPPELLVDD